MVRLLHFITIWYLSLNLIKIKKTFIRLVLLSLMKLDFKTNFLISYFLKQLFITTQIAIYLAPYFSPRSTKDVFKKLGVKNL